MGCGGYCPCPWGPEGIAPAHGVRRVLPLPMGSGGYCPCPPRVPGGGRVLSPSMELSLYSIFSKSSSAISTSQSFYANFGYADGQLVQDIVTVSRQERYANQCEGKSAA